MPVPLFVSAFPLVPLITPLTVVRPLFTVMVLPAPPSARAPFNARSPVPVVASPNVVLPLIVKLLAKARAVELSEARIALPDVVTAPVPSAELLPTRIVPADKVVPPV